MHLPVQAFSSVGPVEITGLFAIKELFSRSVSVARTAVLLVKLDISLLFFLSRIVLCLLVFVNVQLYRPVTGFLL